MNAPQQLTQQLFAMQDLGYRQFQIKLMPTVDPDTVIGIRTPDLRRFAKEYAKQPQAETFLAQLPHRYYEENNLHAMIIETGRDYEKVMDATDAFLPYINNWATCDLFCPKIFGKHLPQLSQKIPQWLASDKTYTVRFGIGMLMRFFLEEHFTLESAQQVADIQSDEYYINMMTAWYFATALAKQYHSILPFFQNRQLQPVVQNMAIQKAIESRRISDEQKQLLRTMKIRA